ncbi:MAG: lytic transglycosylase domain-containing protein [Acidimicrobiia bacterium]
MTSGISSMSAVLARIGAIESRFSIATPQPATTMTNLSSATAITPASSINFEATLAATERAVVRIGSASAQGTIDASTSVAAGGATGTDHVDPSVPYAAEFDSAGERHGISPRILAAVGKVESSYRPDAVSSAGAVGLMQLMPSTATGLGVDPRDPVASIDGAARLLRDMRDRFGSIELALAAYNVGPGTISRAGGILPGSQAEKYVNAVLRTMETST